VIQAAADVACHVHSRATEMVSVPDPPAAPNAFGDDETFASQRVDVGDVTLVEVDAELPQPAATVASANRRGTRTVTPRPLHKPRQLSCTCSAPVAFA
jgi:hypothetical protein